MGAHQEQKKREYVLDGLDCAQCATKIEKNVQQLEGVQQCTLNFATKTLSIVVDEMVASSVERNTKRIVHELEPHVAVKAKESRLLKSYEYELDGLDCGNCATKIERRVAALLQVKESHLNFTLKKLTIKTDASLEAVVRDEIIRIVKELEPHVNVIALTKENRKKQQNEAESLRPLLLRLATGGVIFAAALLTSFSSAIDFILFLIAYGIVGGDVVWRAVKNMMRGQWFDEYFLMTIATVGAFFIGEFPEAVAVMLFYQIGELFQKSAVNASRKSIRALMDIRPDRATVIENGKEIVLSPEDVQLDAIVQVKPGERVPLDGIVVEGDTMLDTSMLTGESVPRRVKEGDEILSGTINRGGVVTFRVTKSFGQSTVSKILELVENASSKKAPTEQFITKFARYYTPAVTFAALAIATIPPIVTGDVFSDWVYRALVFLVISCPCALVVSIPLGFFGGIGRASRQGILVKGGNYLEALNEVKYVVFDKTGTLTKGVFKVQHVHEANGFSNNDVLYYAAHGEVYSNHPIARSLLEAYGDNVQKKLVTNYEEIAGYGIVATMEGKTLAIGNRKLMEREGIEYKVGTKVGTHVLVALDGVFVGEIVIADEVKADAKHAIQQLKKLGVKKTVMLTGDANEIAEEIGKQLQVDEVYAELLPHEKVEKFELLEQRKEKNERIVFVGDGINDTPVLARADIGIAMGGLGSDAAIEVADVVIMTDEPSKIATSIETARRTRRIVWQNIFFAFGVKGIFLLLGAFGVATMWEAVFADVGVTVLAVLNAMRVLRVNED